MTRSIETAVLMNKVDTCLYPTPSATEQANALLRAYFDPGKDVLDRIIVLDSRVIKRLSDVEKLKLWSGIADCKKDIAFQEAVRKKCQSRAPLAVEFNAWLGGNASDLIPRL